MTAAAPSTAATRGLSNQRKGKTAEQAVARYLRAWWPSACRAVRTGSSAAPDPGDIAGVPFIVSVKDCARADWPRWWAELDAMRVDDPAALGVIVEKRRGHADPAEWWAHLRLCDLTGIRQWATVRAGDDAPVRMALGDLVVQLERAGWTR